MVNDDHWRSLGTQGRHVEIVAHRPEWPEYERLKRALASRYRDDRRSYTDRKAEFINRILASVAGARPAEP